LLQMAEFWDDIEKTATDLLKDDYKYGHVLKMKQATPQGVTVTSESTFPCPFPSCCESSSSCGGGRGSSTTAATNDSCSEVSTKLTTKYSHPSGFSVDKFQIDPNGAISTELGLSGVAPDLRFLLKTEASKKGELFLEFKQPHIAIKHSLDILDFNTATLAGSVSSNGVLVGFNTSANLSTRALREYGLALSYRTPTAFLSLKTSNQLANFSVASRLSLRNNLTLVGQLDTTRDLGKKTFTLGCVVNYTPSTTLRAKVNSELVVTGALAHKVAKDVVVSGTVELDAKKTQHRGGICITLG